MVNADILWDVGVVRERIEKDMLQIKDFIEENAEIAKDILIFLKWEKENTFDPLCKVVWEGVLCDIPEEYWENEVVSTGRSLVQLGKGIDAFYLTMSRR